MSKLMYGYPNQASNFQFSAEQVDALLGNAFECALNWSTRDGWPVGVMHVFVWHEGAVWLNFMGHRHRASAMRRDPRVSVIVSSQSAGPDAPQGQATLKGRAVFHDDEATKHRHYRLLAEKMSPGDPAAQQAFFDSLDTPLRDVVEITPEKWITFDIGKMVKDRAGLLGNDERGELLAVDTERMQAEIRRRGLDS